MRVLLVESGARLAATFSNNLRANTFQVDVVKTGDDALYLMRDFEFDLVLLNLVLNDIDGVSLIRQIRTAKHDTAIIALSSIPQARLKALATGADDVVDCNIDAVELAARIRAIVRRSRGFTKSQLQVGGLILDVDSQDVVANDVRVHFTVKEFAILELLVLRRNMILTKETIINQIYGSMDTPEIKIIDVFICKIRTKLKKAGLPPIVDTVWGRGYSVKDIGQEKSKITPVQPQPVRSELTYA